MLIQVLATPEFAGFAQDFCIAWNRYHPADTFKLDIADLFRADPTSMTPATFRPTKGEPDNLSLVPVQGLTISSLRQIRLDAQADLYLVIQPEITGEPGFNDLANLVISRIMRRGGIQPVVVLATDSPLSRRQLQESGIAQAYFFAEHPKRSAAQWGQNLGQTWHLPD